jgi:KDO2-lipid IV(A) lauroyltransferase
VTAVAPVTAIALDRRLGQAWTRRQALKNGLIRSALRAALVALDCVPPSLLCALGVAIGRAAARLDRTGRTRAHSRALACLPEPLARRAADDCFAHAGEHLALSALLRRRATRVSDFVAVPESSLQAFRRALANGRGALVVSAHLGPFEMIPARLVELGFAPAIVVRESYDPELDPVVDAHRTARGVEVIHRGKPEAALRIFRALRSGRPVGLLPDLGGRALPSVPLSFLGARVAFPVGAAQLALRSGCSLILGTLARAAGGAPPYELLFEEIALKEADTPEALTRRVAAEVARAVLRTPSDWLWMAPPHLAIADDSGSSLFC